MPRVRGERTDSPKLFFILFGVGFMGGFFLIFILGPHFLPWPATAALYAPLAGLSAWYLVKHAGRLGNDRAKIAFALGMTLVFVPIDIGGELSGNVGVLVFTALTLVILIGLRRRRGRSIPLQTSFGVPAS